MNSCPPEYRRARRDCIISVATLLGFCILAVACGADGSKVFGELSGPCPATVLTNDFADDQKIESGTDCFIAEFEAGRPVVWDVLAVTVEGDPIPTRYEYDGEIVTITADSSRDTFGSGEVSEQRCVEVRRANRLPKGVDCNFTTGDGFESDSLPSP